MENKLQELTQKLYDEGLAKGREQAETLVTQAQEKADKILSEANYEAERIRRQALLEAEDLRKNTLTELTLAGKQAIAQLKTAIADMIVTRSVGDSVKKANLDPQFVKDILTAAATNWTSNSSDVSLKALLPEKNRRELDAAIGSQSKELMTHGLEIEFSDSIESGFKIGPKEGGYYIGFTDEGFDALLGEYLRPKVKEILFEERQ
ncbi:MAG: hypothetical protein LIO77_04430 [Rikenellaceae bacterium]|nr:hypothetical protein [Rikenellaceae bacterium]